MGKSQALESEFKLSLSTHQYVILSKFLNPSQPLGLFTQVLNGKQKLQWNIHYIVGEGLKRKTSKLLEQYLEYVTCSVYTGNYDSAERIKLRFMKRDITASPSLFLLATEQSYILSNTNHPQPSLFVLHKLFFSVLASNSYMHFKMERDGTYIDYLTPRDSSNQDHLSQNNQNKSVYNLLP